MPTHKKKKKKNENITAPKTPCPLGHGRLAAPRYKTFKHPFHHRIHLVYQNIYWLGQVF